MASGRASGGPIRAGLDKVKNGSEPHPCTTVQISEWIDMHPWLSSLSVLRTQACTASLFSLYRLSHHEASTNQWHAPQSATKRSLRNYDTP